MSSSQGLTGGPRIIGDLEAMRLKHAMKLAQNLQDARLRAEKAGPPGPERHRRARTPGAPPRRGGEGAGGGLVPSSSAGGPSKTSPPRPSSAGSASACVSLQGRGIASRPRTPPPLPLQQDHPLSLPSSYAAGSSTKHTIKVVQNQQDASRARAAEKEKGGSALGPGPPPRRGRTPGPPQRRGGGGGESAGGCGWVTSTASSKPSPRPSSARSASAHVSASRRAAPSPPLVSLPLEQTQQQQQQDPHDLLFPPDGGGQIERERALIRAQIDETRQHLERELQTQREISDRVISDLESQTQALERRLRASEARARKLQEENVMLQQAIFNKYQNNFNN